MGPFEPAYPLQLTSFSFQSSPFQIILALLLPALDGVELDAILPEALVVVAAPVLDPDLDVVRLVLDNDPDTALFVLDLVLETEEMKASVWVACAVPLVS